MNECVCTSLCRAGHVVAHLNTKMHSHAAPTKGVGLFSRLQSASPAAELQYAVGRAVAQAVSRRPALGHMGFVVDKATLGQVLSEDFGFPCHSFHRLLHAHNHPSTGGGRTGKVVADELSGAGFTTPQLQVPYSKTSLVRTARD
jgi:hypothetical protein